MHLSDVQLRDYREQRQKGMKAKEALTYVKWKASVKPIEWQTKNGNEEAWEKIEGFAIRFQKITDYEPDLSALGEFSDTPEEGAILHNRSGDSRILKYFNPAIPEYAKEDYKRMIEYENGYWYMMGVKATVFYKGKEIAESSVWGIESDSDEEYIDEEARNMAEMAIDEAKSWIKSVREEKEDTNLIN